MMTIYKLEGLIPASATTNSIVTLDIILDGLIAAISMGLKNVSGMDALGDALVGEISFMSTNSLGVNDTRGSIAQVSVNQNFLTSGGGIGPGVMSVNGLAIAVNGGERIHLHGLSSTGVSGNCFVYLYVEDASDGGKAQVRRR